MEDIEKIGPNASRVVYDNSRSLVVAEAKVVQRFDS
jgi:hypothetical protein